MKLKLSVAMLSAALLGGISAYAEDEVTRELIFADEFGGEGYVYTNTSGAIANPTGDIPGWTFEKGGVDSFHVYGSTYYGSGVVPKNADNGAPVPTESSEGKTDDGCMVIGANWGTTANAYSQELTLAPGAYTIEYMAYNATKGASPANIATKLTGWVPNSGTAVISDMKRFDARRWVIDEIHFVVTEETKGKIRIGLGGGGGADTSAWLCVDYVRLYKENSDVTYLIKNPSFEDELSGWTNSGMQTQTNTDFGLKHGSYYCEKWSGSPIQGTFGVKQTVNIATKGKYRLSAVAMNKGTDTNYKGLWLYAGSKEVLVGVAQKYELEFDVLTENANIEIGFRGDNPSGNYVTVDNFHLEYLEPIAEAKPVTLTVNVKDNVHNEALENATVTVKGNTVTTGEDGVATFNQFTTDDILDLTATVSADNFETQTLPITWGDGDAKTIDVTLVRLGNMMADVFTGIAGTSTPSEPWYAYNTSSNQFGGGNGWQFRAAGGGKNDTSAAAQIFWRWNDSNSAWVYAYKVSLKAGTKYVFTCDAATNENKSNTLKVSYVTDMAQAKTAAAQSYVLDGHNEGAVFTNPVKVVYNFENATDEDVEAYLVFNGTNKNGNVIVRAANFGLYEDGAVDFATAFNALKDEANDYLAAQEEGDVKSLMATGAEYAALAEALAIEVANATNTTILQNAFNAYKAGVASYAAYVDALPIAQEVLADAEEKYADASEAAVQNLQEAVEMPENIDAATAATAAQDMHNAYRRVVESHHVAEKHAAEPVELGDWTGIDRTNTGEGPTLHTGEKVGTYFDQWTGSAWNFDHYQTVDLAPGTYRLSVLSRGQNMEYFTLYMNGAEVEADKVVESEDPESVSIEMGHIGNQGGYFGNGWNMYSVDYTVKMRYNYITIPVEEETPEDTPAARAPRKAKVLNTTELVAQPVTIGLKASSPNWASFHNLQLVQISKNVNTGVNELAADENAEVEYYNLQGVKVQNPEAGLYIVRKGGKTYKTILK